MGGLSGGIQSGVELLVEKLGAWGSFGELEISERASTLGLNEISVKFSTVFIKCFLLRRYVAPSLVWTVYDLALCLLMTFAGLQNFPVCRRTESLIFRADNDFADLSKFNFCSALDLCTFSCTVEWFTVSGWSSLFVMGTTDFVLREKSNWAGDWLQSNNGKFRNSRSAMYGSWPLSFAFVSNFLAIPILFSANPLQLGCKGKEVWCLNPHSLVKSRNASEVNWGLLSLMHMSIRPLRDKCTLSFWMTVAARLSDK